MNTKFTIEKKEQVVSLKLCGKSVAAISEEVGVSRSTIYFWLKENKSSQAKKVQSDKQKIYLLEKKVTRLTTLLQIIQESGCSLCAPLKEKLDALTLLHGKYSVHELCDALQVSRGTFYNHILRNKKDSTWYSKRREELKEEIQKIFEENKQIFGAGKITAILKTQGCKTSQTMVRGLMHDMGLFSIRSRAKSLYEKEKRDARQNKLRQQFNTTKPNTYWVSDVTAFRHNNKYYYICVVLDLFSRKIVSYHVSLKNSTHLTKTTFKKAYESSTITEKLLFHSDNGANYTSYTFTSYLKSLNITQSFSRPYVPYDNSVCESFFASMKQEELYRTKYRSEKELLKLIAEYIDFYNNKRPHSKNSFLTPSKKEENYYAQQ